MPVDGYVAGDDPAAKQKVLELVSSLGFTPVDVGPLMNARTLEGMGWLNIPAKHAKRKVGGWLEALTAVPSCSRAETGRPPW